MHRRWCLGVLLAVSATAAQGQQVGLAFKDGDLNGDLTYLFSGPPNDAYIHIISLTDGPTCFPSPHTVGCVDVGLELFGFSFQIPGFFGTFDATGSKQLTFPIPNDPALDGVALRSILLHITSGVLDAKSEVAKVTFAPKETFSTSLDSMLRTRLQAPIVTLNDGRVLIPGGDEATLRGVEAYNWRNEGFEQLKRMKEPRLGHTATRLQDGRVLVVGGADLTGAVRVSAEIYDPTMDAWTLVGTPGAGRAGHMANLLPDGRVLVSGGSSDFTDEITAIISAQRTTELFDPITETFSAGPDMARPHTGHVATTLANGDVLVAGGLTVFRVFGAPIPEISDEGQVFDASGGTFGPERAMNDRRAGSAAALLPDGRVLLAGGLTGDLSGQSHLDDAELFDPVTEQFSRGAGSLSLGRSLAAIAPLADGRFLLAGGDIGTLSTGFTPVPDADLYDPVTDQFTATTPLIVARNRPLAVLLPDCSVGVFIGNENNLTAELFHH